MNYDDTYEELKEKFPSNFMTANTLRGMLDESVYKYEKFVAHVTELRKVTEDAKTKRDLLLRHLENAVVGVNGQTLYDLLKRVVVSLNLFEDSMLRANTIVSTIVENLENSIGIINGVTTTEKVFYVDLDEFVAHLHPDERRFFEEVRSGQLVRSSMSVNQRRWLDNICKRATGFRYNDIFFSKKTKPEDLDSDLE